MSKITKATFKSFIRKNPDFKIKISSEFDSMTDGIQQVNSGFNKAVAATYPLDNNLGFQGIWLVGGSGNYFREYNAGGMKGIEVHNCCGTFVVAV